MKRRIVLKHVFCIVATALVLLPSVLVAQPLYSQDRILVKLKPGLSSSQMASLHYAAGVRVVRTFRELGNLQVVKLPMGTSVPDAVRRYQMSRWVEYAEPDYVLNACVTNPNDTLYQQGYLWGLNNYGQEGGTPGADIRAPQAWDIARNAQNVIVAVIDTGTRYTHEDITDNMWVNPNEIPDNNIDDDDNGYVDDVHGISTIANVRTGNPLDDHGHGTFVAGIIGAVGNNNLGVVGVSWRTQIMSCKFLDESGSGYTSDAIDCICYAIMQGASVINASWGGYSSSIGLRNAIALARSAGVIFVATAGNEGTNNDEVPFYPSAFNLDNIVSVTASDRFDSIEGFNYGPESVDFATPGVDIVSTWNPSDEAYAIGSGTSAATAYASGAFALMKSFYPGRSYSKLISFVLAGVDKKDDMIGRIRSGGRLNLYKSLSASRPVPLSLTPNSGTLSTNVKFTLSSRYSDPEGNSDIKNCYLLLNSTLTGVNGVYLLYNPGPNKLYIRNDANTAWVGGFTPGSAHTIENSQFRLYCAETTRSVSGSTLTINWKIALKSSMSGRTPFDWMLVVDQIGLRGGWKQMGRFTVR